MSWLTNTLTSTIGRKLVMSLTGLFLVSFLIVHLSGNFTLLLDDVQPFNDYSAFMSSHWTIRILEIGLVAGFFIHIYTAVVLTKKNRSARPQSYAYEKAGENSSWFSRNMGLTGTVILLFLLLHLYNFWFRYKFGEVALDENGVKDMYGLVVQTFQQEAYLAIYILAFVLLGMHLNHGFQSAFQTLGLNHRKYTPMIKTLGSIVAIAFPLGFIVVAVACYLK